MTVIRVDFDAHAAMTPEQRARVETRDFVRPTTDMDRMYDEIAARRAEVEREADETMLPGVGAWLRAQRDDDAARRLRLARAGGTLLRRK
jgi:hypothetical protein